MCVRWYPDSCSRESFRVRVSFRVGGNCPGTVSGRFFVSKLVKKV